MNIFFCLAHVSQIRTDYTEATITTILMQWRIASILSFYSTSVCRQFNNQLLYADDDVGKHRPVDYTLVKQQQHHQTRKKYIKSNEIGEKQNKCRNICIIHDENRDCNNAVIKDTGNPRVWLWKWCECGSHLMSLNTPANTNNVFFCVLVRLVLFFLNQVITLSYWNVMCIQYSQRPKLIIFDQFRWYFASSFHSFP